MINGATRAELELMAKRAYPDVAVTLGESPDGRVLYVYGHGGRFIGRYLVHIEHDADKVAGAMWSALDALQPAREGSDDA